MDGEVLKSAVHDDDDVLLRAELVGRRAVYGEGGGGGGVGLGRGELWEVEEGDIEGGEAGGDFTADAG